MLGSALSQLLNVLTASDLTKTGPNESVSARAYRQDLPRKRWINAIFFLQDNHCKSAYLSDVYDAEELLKEHKSIETE
jgi:hypothetical protein